MFLRRQSAPWGWMVDGLEHSQLRLTYGTCGAPSLRRGESAALLEPQRKSVKSGKK